MTQFSTDINVVIRDREFRIDIYGDVDRDGFAENIEMFWQNVETKFQKDLPKRVRTYIEKEYAFEIDEAISLAAIDDGDFAYDCWKERYT
tara:strand:- start:9 stop:278 length:270 start_codon:yes stop_codon:yes gene_type:complete